MISQKVVLDYLALKAIFGPLHFHYYLCKSLNGRPHALLLYLNDPTQKRCSHRLPFSGSKVSGEYLPEICPRFNTLVRLSDELELARPEFVHTIYTWRLCQHWSNSTNHWRVACARLDLPSHCIRSTWKVSLFILVFCYPKCRHTENASSDSLVVNFMPDQGKHMDFSIFLGALGKTQELLIYLLI